MQTKIGLRMLAVTLLSAALFMSGCSGDDGINGINGVDGANGLNGADGAAGLNGKDGSNGQNGIAGINGKDGANGLDGKDGKNAEFTPVESCSVCHSDGNVASAHSGSNIGDLAISNIVPAAAGADLVVTFNAKLNGVNKTGYFNSISSDYRLRFSDMTRRDLSTDDATTVGNPVSLGSGNYSVTIPGGVTANAGVNSRYMIRVQNTADAALSPRPAGARALVLFDYPATPATDVIGASTSCADCHGSIGTGFHYGYPSYGGKTCTVCHDAVNVQSLAVDSAPPTLKMIHGIHNSANMPTGSFVLSNQDTPTPQTWTFSIAFPSYMSNCSICHQTGAPLTAANAKPVSYNFCMTCHQNWDGFGASTFGNVPHRNMIATTNCSACHEGTIAPATVVAVHNAANILTERGGRIYDGTDLSVTEGAKISMKITGVTRTGNNLAVNWTATYNGAAVNPCNATPTATAPAFNYTGQNFSILKAFFQGDDLVNANNGNTSPGQPNSTNLIFSGATQNTVCASNVATSTIALTAAEALLKGYDPTLPAKGRVGLQGKPQMMPVAPGTAITVRAFSPIYDFNLATGAAVATRRAITDSSLCLKCHVGSLYQHGGNRVDNVELCVMCHNEASSEQNVRVGMGVDATEAYDGKGGQTYGFKTMLHAVHSSGNQSTLNAGEISNIGLNPLVIYRTRGIYAFGPSVAALPNWPGTSTGETDRKLVFGADPAAPTAMQPHFFITAHYPRQLSDCSACHVSGSAVIPDQTKSVATTIYTGVAPYDNQINDTLQGTAAASCTSCHQSATVKAHSTQNGWVPTTFINGRQTIIDAAK